MDEPESPTPLPPPQRESTELFPRSEPNLPLIGSVSTGFTEVPPAAPEGPWSGWVIASAAAAAALAILGALVGVSAADRVANALAAEGRPTATAGSAATQTATPAPTKRTQAPEPKKTPEPTESKPPKTAAPEPSEPGETSPPKDPIALAVCAKVPNADPTNLESMAALGHEATGAADRAIRLAGRNLYATATAQPPSEEKVKQALLYLKTVCGKGGYLP